MKQEKVLVTGGAGFIGSHIVDALVALKYQVVVIDDLSYGKKSNLNKQAKFYQIKIQDKKLAEIFKANKFSYVFHLAAQKNVRVSVNDPELDADVNIIGSLNLLENCRKYQLKKVIFSSTGGAIYGDATKLPTPEGYAEWPMSPYGVAKLSIEKYLHYYNIVHKLPYVALRYSNVFGPRQDPAGEAGVVAIFISKLLQKQQPVINGLGLQTRDYVYVKDVVQANILAFNKKAQGIYNVGVAKQTNVNELYQKIAELMQSNIKAKHGKALMGEQLASCLSNQKIKKQLGFKINYNLEQGLIETINWFKKNKI